MTEVKFSTKVFADMISGKRKWKELSVREAANEIDISAATLSRIENEHLPDLITAKKIANWLHLDLDYFFNKIIIED